MTRFQMAAAITGATAGAAVAGYLIGRASQSEQADERRYRRFFGDALNTKQLVDSFVECIRNETPSNLRAFEKLRRTNPESALAEAVVFGVLQQLNLRPTISDVPGIGGADFLCTHKPSVLFNQKWQFVVEATTLELGAISKNSSWPNDVPDHLSGGPFGLITERIIDRAANKIPQLAKHPMPRLLAIASSHVGAHALFGTEAAMQVLISPPKIRQPLDGSPASQSVDLECSAFLRVDPSTGKIVAQRESISAVLLVSIAGDRTFVLGVLHPEPRYALNLDAVPKIPFVKIAQWPIENRRIRVEWVLGQPSAREFKHKVIRPENMRKATSASF